MDPSWIVNGSLNRMDLYNLMRSTMFDEYKSNMHHNNTII